MHAFKANQTSHPSGIDKTGISLGWELKVLMTAGVTV
jgi:hypothetical protein